MDEKELKLLWESISKDFDIGDFDYFKSKMTESGGRKKFYDAFSAASGGKQMLQSLNPKFSDFSGFDVYIEGLKKKEPSVPTVPSVQQQPVSVPTSPSQLPSQLPSVETGGKEEPLIPTGEVPTVPTDGGKVKPIGPPEPFELELDLTDPIGSLRSKAYPVVQIRPTSDISTYVPVGQRPVGEIPEAIPTTQEAAQSKKDYENFVALYRTNPTFALAHLSKATGKTEQELLATPFPELDKLIRTGNETDAIAIETTKRIKSANRSFDPNTWLNGRWSVGRAAVAYASENDPVMRDYIRQNMQPVVIKKADGTEERINIYPKPEDIFGEGTIGMLVDRYLSDPIIQAQATNSPFAADFQQAQKDLLTKYLPYGIAKVGNKVSQAYEDSNQRGFLSRIGQMGTENIFRELDEVAKKTLTPQEYQEIYVPYIKGNEEKYISMPTFLGEEGIYGGIENVFKGIGKSVTEPFIPSSETQREEWERQATNISATPSKTWALGNNAGHMLGFVMGMYVSKNLLSSVLAFGEGAVGAESLMSPNAINAVNTGLVFFGDNLQRAKLKYPNDPMKAITSSAVSTALFIALSKDLFPTKAVQNAIGAVRPEIEGVTSRLASGAISKEAARRMYSGIGDKALQILNKSGQVVTGALKQNVKASLEMGAITAFERGVDNVLGLDKDKQSQFYSKNAEIEAATNMFLSNIFVAGFAGAGMARHKNRAAIETYYDAASRPDYYRNIVQEGKGSPEIKQEALANIDFVQSLKRELDARGMSQSKQKAYIANALAERALVGQKTPDENLRRANDAAAQEIKSEQQELLRNPQDEIEITDEGIKPVSAETAAGEVAPTGEARPIEVAEEFRLRIPGVETEMPSPEVLAETRPEVPAEARPGVAPETRPEVPRPTKEQELKDIQEGNVASFTYGSEADVPEVFKDKISSKGEINGKPYVKVTVAKSLADYEIARTREAAPEVPAKAPVPSIIEVKSPKEVKQGDTVVWRGEDFTVEEVNSKGGFNLRNVKEPTNTVKDARITDEEFQGKRGEVPTEAKTGVPESAYLKNIRPNEIYGEGNYSADFGRNGGITWEIPESQREKDAPDYLIVQSIDRNKDTGEAPKEDSKGEGARAIADLFNKYPSVKEIVYDDYAESNFWQKIGGDNQSLKREDFFRYYNSKFPAETKPEVPEPTLKPEEYAVQEQAAGEVPVQPEARVGEEMEGRVPPARPQEIAKEGKVEGQEGEVIAGAEPDKMVGIKHEATEKMRTAFSLPEYERPEGKTMAELEAEADREIKEGYNIESLVQKLEKGNAPSGVENVILAKYLGALNADFERTRSKETLAKIERVANALDVIGTIQSEAFRTRKIMKPKEETLAQYFMEEKLDAGVEELTPQQEARITKEYQEIKAATEALQKKVEQLQEENARIKAEKVIAGEKTKVKKTRKTDDEFRQERKVIVNDIKDKLKKARSQANVSVVPYANELFAISPEVAKLVKSYVEQGVVKLETIITEIHQSLKDDIPDITEKDVQDLIAGEYREKKKTRNEIAAQVRDLKTEAKLLNQYEKLEKGEVPKSEKRVIERNRKLAELRKQIKESDVNKLAQAKESLNKRIEKLENQLKTGDFEPAPEREKIKLDEEGKKLQTKLNKLKRERDIRRLRLQYERQNKVQKTVNKILDVFNVPRSLMASTDLSAPLRQAFIATTNYPKEAREAAIQMIKAAKSQEAFNNWFYELKETPRYELMKKLKLGISDPLSPELTAGEEAFMSKYAEKIPVAGKLVEGSERAYVQYLSKLRADLFNRFIDKFESQGKTYENSRRLYESTAKYINNITGRGDLGKLDKFTPLLSALMFSPRFAASNINLLNPYYFATLPKELKIQYGKDMGTTIALVSTVLSLFSLYGSTQKDDDKNKITVETDPRSSDFARIKQGNTRWDITGGFQPYIRLAAQLAPSFLGGGKRKKITGEFVELDGKAPGTSRADVLVSFFRNKLAPIPASIWDLSTGKNAVGEKVTLRDEIIGSIVPLLFQSIYEGYKEQGPQALATVGIPSVFGIGVSTYGQRIKEVPDTIRFEDRTIELSDEQRDEFQRLFEERNKRNIDKLKSLPEYTSASKELQGQLEQIVEGKSISEAKELLGKKYKNEFMKQPKRVVPIQERRIRRKFGID